MLLKELNSLIRTFQILPDVEGGHSTLSLSGNIEQQLTSDKAAPRALFVFLVTAVL